MASGSNPAVAKPEEGNSSALVAKVPQSDQEKNVIDQEKNKSDQEEKYDDRRLWLGNLDPKLTEFQLLKLIQRFGSIENFDFLFHRSGPNAGLPRGYAFITFKNPDDACKCLDGLNGKRILERNISVRYAHQASYTYTDEEEKLRKKLPALGMKSEPETSASKERTISAIEAKLRAMERDKEEQDNFSLTSVGVNKNKAVTTRTAAIIHYPYAKPSSHHHSYDIRTRSKPYSRNYPKKRY